MEIYFPNNILIQMHVFNLLDFDTYIFVDFTKFTIFIKNELHSKGNNVMFFFSDKIFLHLESNPKDAKIWFIWKFESYI